MSFFKRKTNKEIAAELRKTKNQRMKVENRNNLQNELKEEKSKLFNAKYRKFIDAAKNLAENFEEEFNLRW